MNRRMTLVHIRYLFFLNFRVVISRKAFGFFNIFYPFCFIFLTFNFSMSKSVESGIFAEWSF